ncbi:MAG TPA: CoA pyrophosphatase [Actinomycetota bacterium]|nr:CoA pyrophosphatase [Actinomycetota bacterium]
MRPSFGPETFERVREALSGVAPGPVTQARSAAVLVPLFLDGERVRVLLTKRSENLRTHRGEVSFPGGTREPEDVDLRATAEREAFEEVALRPDDVAHLGVLDDLPTAGSGILIRPYVVRVPHPYDYVPDTREVERLLTPPLDLFADVSARRIEMFERGGVRYPVYFFDHEGDVVWGATARMLVALIERLDGREPDWTVVPRPPASVEEDLA